MLLSDKTIDRLLEAGDIVVEPEITDEQLQPASLDVRLGSELYDIDADRLYEGEWPGTVTVEPHTPYIGHTHDRIELPDDIAAMLTGRSTYGRLFVTVHQTAGWLDPGFEGQITLEIFNFSDEPIEIPVEERVGQLVFFELDQPSSGYEGRYQGQEGIATSRE